MTLWNMDGPLKSLFCIWKPPLEILWKNLKSFFFSELLQAILYNAIYFQWTWLNKIIIKIW